tara:strand:- start:81 stop:410 length:330 start_codon:yes stop_codon:yes gene_type:complete
MGLHVYIYKCEEFSDCTNGGVSSSPKVKGFTLTNIEGPHEPSESFPAAKLKKGHLNSVHIKPAWNEDEHTMFGGNYAASSDSRLSKAMDDLVGNRFYGAVAIHDRVEDY